MDTDICVLDAKVIMTLGYVLCRRRRTQALMEYIITFPSMTFRRPVI